MNPIGYDIGDRVLSRWGRRFVIRHRYFAYSNRVVLQPIGEGMWDDKLESDLQYYYKAIRTNTCDMWGNSGPCA